MIEERKDGIISYANRSRNQHGLEREWTCHKIIQEQFKMLFVGSIDENEMKSDDSTISECFSQH